MHPIPRRTVLRLSVPATLGVAGSRAAVAEPIDGKGNDVCPCFLDISEARLVGETVEVSGRCGGENPPETVTVRVQVRGERGARATGASTFACAGRAGEAGGEEEFSVAATIRGNSRFARNDDVTVDATAHLRPEDAPDIITRWQWTGTLC